MNNTVNRASLGAKKNKIFKSGFCEKLKLLLIPIGLLIGGFTMQVWGYTDTWRCVPGLSFSNWHEGTDICKVTIEVTGKDKDGGPSHWNLDMAIDDDYVYEDGEGNIYKIYYVTKTNLPNDGARQVKFMRYEGSTWKEDSKQYDGWMNTPAWSLRLYRGSWDWPACEYGENYKKWDVEAGTTIVWDAGNQSWPTAQLYLYNKSGNQGDDLTKLGSTQQFVKTYGEKWEGYGGLIFRQDGSWTAQSTNIHEDVSSSSNITLFTHCRTYSSGKSDWQKVSPAYKASDGATIYFDNTDANYSDPYVKWGSDWYNRAGDMDVVPGTNGKLYKYTFPHDVYYGEYLVSDGYGYTNDYYCTEDHCDYYTALQNANISSATTLIPSAKSAGASTSVLDGYERTVTISSYSHGTVHVTYTDANNAAQDESSGNFNVQQACVITVTATADEGYRLTGLTVGGAAFTSGNTYPVRDDIDVTATFTPKSCSITFDKEGGEGGSDGTTATYDADMPAITLPHIIGYKFDGYWDGNDGTGNQYYKADGTSYCTWNKNTESPTTLYAKWVADNNVFTNTTGNGDWNTAGNWSAKVVPTNNYAAVQLTGELTVSSHIYVGTLDLTNESAKLTIASNGTLEVAGTITNTDPDKLVIQTGNEGQGALIYDITQTAPHATVNMTTKYAAGSRYQYIASPIGGVSVADVFSGKGAYTYVWKEGIGWERRGYYDDIAAFEPIALKGKGSCSFVGQLYPGTTSLSLSYTETPTSTDAQGVNMLANALTAPIKIAAMTITGSSDGSVHVWNNGDWEESAVETAGEDVIPAMQVYAILANSSGSVSFDYETAVRGASDKNAALKAPKRITSDIPEHLTISVRTNERDIDLQLYEDEMFTNEIDKGWEAIYMEGDGRFGELYAQADEKMSILATPDLEGTILGFAPGETSDYTISFNGDGKGYYLNDMKEQTSTLIAEENTYMFSPDESTNATRFVISRTPIHKVPTGTENVSSGTNARKQMINGVLYIIRDGRIYNAEGALVK